METTGYWRILAEWEAKPLPAGFESAPVIAFEALCIDRSSALRLIERYAGSTSLHQANALCYVLCKYVQSVDDNPLDLLVAFHKRFRFRGHDASMSTLLGTVSYSIQRNRFGVQCASVAALCVDALTKCEEMLGNRDGLVSKVPDLLEILELIVEYAMIDALLTPDERHSLLLSIERLHRMLDYFEKRPSEVDGGSD